MGRRRMLPSRDPPVRAGTVAQYGLRDDELPPAVESALTARTAPHSRRVPATVVQGAPR